MSDTKTVKEKDFVEIKYSGYANSNLFDSNIEEDLKKLNPESKPEKVIICIGQKMLVSGLDSQLEGKEIGKEYEIEVKAEDGFGQRKREMMKVIPLRAFSEQKVSPAPGMMFTLDNALVKVVAVSGARVTVDFNNPLAGKDLKYKITLTRKVEDVKEKAKTIISYFLRFLPEMEIKEKVILKGPKILEQMIDPLKDKFKELVGKELAFEEKKPEKEKPVKQEDLNKEVKTE
ncbi:MAG: FKBP-type peptidyl-prolyl cis-trans isomerase [Nanoarchaeota archaeon]|nr:FKBP-type peptidyl-prolyl cis-trans isomerase [Nanoarchaeota archaeon]MBU0977576.1 FKBP-type peptidyl-prolyl cis-trans isomerase [Nanoarchaeota archaeon]